MIHYNGGMQRVAIQNPSGVYLLFNRKKDHRYTRIKECPAFLIERFALLRLLPINKSADTTAIGRRFSDDEVIAYLSPEEYLEVLNGNTGKQSKR
jgi:hypothetical protein